MLSYSSDSRGDPKYAVFSTIAFVLYILQNIGFFIFYHLKLKKDPDFEYWRKTQRKTSVVISVLGLIFSFNIYKLFYSHFFGLDCFKAPFAKPATFQKAMILFSIANLVLCCALILSIDIVGLRALDHWRT